MIYKIAYLEEISIKMERINWHWDYDPALCRLYDRGEIWLDSSVVRAFTRYAGSVMFFRSVLLSYYLTWADVVYKTFSFLIIKICILQKQIE